MPLRDSRDREWRIESSARLGRSLRVVADTEHRVMRCGHYPRRGLRSCIREAADGVLDTRGRELVTDLDSEPTWSARLEGPGNRVCVPGSPFRKWRGSADRL